MRIGQGETITPAPIIANEKVIIGFSGDEFAARRVTAYNLADGKKVWECHSTGGDKDVCLTSNTNRSILVRHGRQDGDKHLCRRRVESAAAARLGLVSARSALPGVLRHRQSWVCGRRSFAALNRADAGQLQRQVRQQMVT